MNNKYTLESLKGVCKQKSEMYTTWQIGWTKPLGSLMEKFDSQPR